MKAFTSDQAGMYAGDNGAFRLAVQTGDGVSMTRNVEALDTIFLISDQNKVDESIFLSLWFEMEKSDNLPILGYYIDDDKLVGLEPFNPEHLPPLDMQHAWRVVKEQFSSVDWQFSKSLVTVAQVSMVYVVGPWTCPTVSFLIKRADDPDTTGRCWEYIYDIETDSAHWSGFVPPCWVKFPTETVDQCEATSAPKSSFVDSTLCP